MKQLPNQELEIKIAYLERHTEEQDRAILELRKDIDRLRAKVDQLQTRLDKDSDGGNPLHADERPPHY